MRSTQPTPSQRAALDFPWRDADWRHGLRQARQDLRHLQKLATPFADTEAEAP